MTTPLTPDEERKLAEAVFYGHTIGCSLRNNIYSHDIDNKRIYIDYERNTVHWKRLVEFIFVRLRAMYEDVIELEKLDGYRFRLEYCIVSKDTESLKRLALELIP